MSDDHDLDVELAKFAQLAYSAAPTIVGPLGGAHALIKEVDASIIVAIRGTATPMDWIADFMLQPQFQYRESSGFLFIHRGFALTANAIMGPITAAIAGRPCYVTGHSLGGAIALILAEHLKESHNTPKAVVTFGAPRVGFSAFAALFDGITVRQYRRGNDPVPTIPVALPLFPYCHVRPLIQIGTPDDNNPFSCHHIAGYVADIEGLEDAGRLAIGGVA